MADVSGTVVYRGSAIINVFTGETSPGDIVVGGGLIRSVTPPGQGVGDRIIDVSGTLASPGFMDAHTHTESSLLNLPELARLILPHGTTSLFTNPHEIANVMGVEGVRRHLAEGSRLPIRLYLVSPCKVPAAPGLETTGAAFSLPEILELLNLPDTVAAGEFDAMDVLRGDENQRRVLDAVISMGKIPCGHAPGVVGPDLQTLAASGIADDHESHGVMEAIGKIRLGITVFLREGTTERNTGELVAGMFKEGFPLNGCSRVCFCTDDKHPTDIVRNGHINENLKIAVSAGMDPIAAIRAATINCATHYGLRNLGAITPGYMADIVFLGDLRDFRPRAVVSKGHLAYMDGKPMGGSNTDTGRSSDDSSASSGAPWPNTVNTGDLTGIERKLRLPSPDHGRTTVTANVIGLVPDQIITRHLRVEIPVGADGTITLPQGLNKVCVLDRYTASGRLGMALIDGFGLKGAAIASSVAHDHHNLVAVGDNDGDILMALEALRGMGGGFAAVGSGRVLAALPLPMAGLMTDMTLEAVNESLEALNSGAKAYGCRVHSPFMSLSFVTLPVVPELGITDMGLIDVRKGAVIPAFD